jgi:hypothetical protein
MSSFKRPAITLDMGKRSGVLDVPLRANLSALAGT